MPLPLIASLVLRPYVAGHPSFRLELRDTHCVDARGCTSIAYTLTEIGSDGDEETLFDSDGFCPSPLYADDSPETVMELLVFLTLRPGNTDAEYFESYTARQLAFCRQHAETLSMYAREDCAEARADIEQALAEGAESDE